MKTDKLWLTLAVAIIVLLIGALFYPVFAQHAGHRPQDIEIHKRFYNSWNMPDNRTVSCCHDMDCQPAQAYQDKQGNWWARQEGDADKPYTLIPPQKIETERDNPDGRNHLCGRRYFFSGDFTVFCFIAGGGT